MIDHIAAVVIGATILFMALAMIYKSQDSSIQATQVDLAKSDLRVLVDILEQDLNNMGSGLGNPNGSPAAADRVVTAYATVSGYDRLEFQALQDYSSSNPVQVAYRWRQQGTATFPDGTSVDTFEIERQVGGTTTLFDKVTALSITLRDDDFMLIPLGSDPSDLVRVRYIDVDLGMVSPVGTEDLLQQTRWSKRFRPVNTAGSRMIIAARPY